MSGRPYIALLQTSHVEDVVIGALLPYPVVVVQLQHLHVLFVLVRVLCLCGLQSSVPMYEYSDSAVLPNNSTKFGGTALEELRRSFARAKVPAPCANSLHASAQHTTGKGPTR